MSKQTKILYLMVAVLFTSVEIVRSASMQPAADQRQGPILVANDPESILLMKAYKYLADAADVLELVLQRHKKLSNTIGKRDAGDNGDWEFMRFGK